MNKIVGRDFLKCEDSYLVRKCEQLIPLAGCKKAIYDYKNRRLTFVYFDEFSFTITISEFKEIKLSKLVVTMNEAHLPWVIWRELGGK